jgi:hypothetical protein
MFYDIHCVCHIQKISQLNFYCQCCTAKFKIWHDSKDELWISCTSISPNFLNLRHSMAVSDPATLPPGYEPKCLFNRGFSGPQN